MYLTWMLFVDIFPSRYCFLKIKIALYGGFLTPNIQRNNAHLEGSENKSLGSKTKQIPLLISHPFPVPIFCSHFIIAISIFLPLILQSPSFAHTIL